MKASVLLYDAALGEAAKQEWGNQGSDEAEETLLRFSPPLRFLCSYTMGSHGNTSVVTSEGALHVSGLPGDR
jgi:hypothetical protein